MPAVKIKEGRRANKGLDNSIQLEPYRVTEIQNAYSEEELFAAPGVQIGDEHDERPGLICIDFILLGWTTKSEGHVGVLYVSNRTFGAAPRSESRIVGDLVEIELPVFQSAGPSIWHRSRDHKILRSRVSRIEQRIRSHAILPDIQADNFNKTGGWYALDGLIYIFRGSSVREMQSGQILVQYTFEALGRVRGFPSGTYAGNAVTIPQLVPNGWYAIDTFRGGNAPSIVAVDPQNLYPQITTLAGLT